MTTRDDLRRRATEVRTKLQGRVPSTPPVANLAPVAPWWSSYVNEVVWGSVWGRDGLDLRYRSVATISCISALQRLPQLHIHLPDALRLGLSPGEIIETIVQVGWYAGVPASYNALVEAGEVFEEQEVPMQDAGDPWDYSRPLRDLETRGRALYEELTGEEGPYEASAADELAPWFTRLMMQYGYGMLWHRSVLDRKSRVVCEMAALTALRVNSALRESIDSALNVGITADEIVEILCHTAIYAGFPAAMAALEVAKGVFDERDDS